MTLGLLEFFWGADNPVSTPPAVVVTSKGGGKHQKSSYQLLSEEFWLDREQAMTDRIPQPATPALPKPASYYAELQQTLDTAMQAKLILQNQLRTITKLAQLKDVTFKLKQLSVLIIKTTDELNRRP